MPEDTFGALFSCSIPDERVPLMVSPSSKSRGPYSPPDQLLMLPLQLPQLEEEEFHSPADVLVVVDSLHVWVSRHCMSVKTAANVALPPAVFDVNYTQNVCPFHRLVKTTQEPSCRQ